MTEETKKEETKREEEKEKEEKKQEAESEEIEVPKKFKKIVEEIEKMSVLDLSELVKILEKKFGVSGAVPVMAGPVAAPQTGGETEAKEEKTEFNVVLTGSGDKKIEVIKVVKEITGKGLKEAKDLVDAVASGPQVIKEKAKKEEAEEIKKKLEEAGAQVELK